MKPLTGLDAAFLYLETPNTPMNTVGAILLDPSSAAGFSYERILRMVAERLPKLPPLRRRLVEIPFGLDHPVWIEDPEFDLRRHVRRIEATDPLSDRDLARITAKLAAKPLDRSRPLWELWLVEGLTGERAALVYKIHHAAADGVASAGLILQLLDAAPEPEATAPCDVWQPDEVPSAPELMGRAITQLSRRPLRLARLVGESARRAREVAGAGTGAPLPLTAPRMRFSRPVSRRRAVAHSRARLEDVRFVKSVFGATVNDVVMAACTRAIRNYLEAQGEVPDEPLLATVPVSVRGAHEWHAYGNRLSTLFVRLPVHLTDPLEQLLEVQGEARVAKRMHATLGASALGDWAQHTAPRLFETGARLYSKLRLAELHRPIHNLVISNVPGPSETLYAAGARVEAAYPHGPIFDGAALNLTVVSYRDSLDFGVLACSEAVPDPGELALGFGAAIGDLVKAAMREAPAESGGRPGAAA